MWFYAEFSHAKVVYPVQNGVQRRMVNSQSDRRTASCIPEYSRVPNKQGGENNRGGGLEMARYNNNRGVRIIGGAWRNRK